jgi:hypothetical protein
MFLMFGFGPKIAGNPPPVGQPRRAVLLAKAIHESLRPVPKITTEFCRSAPIASDAPLPPAALAVAASEHVTPGMDRGALHRRR